jgi:dephospho-CoA kinase
MKVALTGGIGCGKSFVLSLFGEAGWLTVDCDAIARELLTRDAATIDAVRELFGEGAILPEGSVNRAEVARRVFHDKEALAKLEAILHPRIRAGWEGALAAAGNRPVIVEIPLLFEKNLEKLFGISVCVSTAAETQLVRLAQRGVGRSDALARMARQMPLARKELLADAVISNNGNKDFTRAQVAHFIRQAQ